MAQSYDKIFRENIEQLVVPLATKLLNLTIPALEEIPDDLQITIERKPDFLKKVRHVNAEEDYILHFEIQTTDDPLMLERMLEYFGLLYRKYRLPVKQYVFYIGEGQSAMKTRLVADNISFVYQLVSTTDVDYELFLQSEVPEEIVLSILGNFSARSPEAVIEQILSELQDVEPEPRRLMRYIKQLEVLSKLRNLQKLTIQIAEQMALVYDIETDIRYRQGLEKGERRGLEQGLERGIERGLKQGIERGIERGIEQGIGEGIELGLSKAKQAVVRQLLKQGILSVEQIAEAADVSAEQVRQMAD